MAWANALPASARACFSALYQGSGAGANRQLVRLRRLTGADGLRPIRVRLVSCLVPPFKARLVGQLVAPFSPRSLAPVLAVAPEAAALINLLPHFIAQAEAAAEEAEAEAKAAVASGDGAEAEEGKAAEALGVAEELRRRYTAAPASAEVAFNWPRPRNITRVEGLTAARPEW